MSDQIRSILERHRVSTYELDVSSLPKLDSRKTVPSWEEDSVDAFDLPGGPGVEDAFWYRIVLDRRTCRYWIERNGGVAGVTDVFGPGRL
jgi:hypothetical protein